jgi:hypothetical protein
MVLKEGTKKEINECIEECEGAFTNLRNAINQLPDGAAKQRMQSAGQNLDACINDCRSTLNQP